MSSRRDSDCPPSGNWRHSSGSAAPPIAQLDLIQWVAATRGLSELDAYQLLTQAVESPLANVCDTNYTSVAKVRKEWLPPALSDDGVHARLRARAADYTG